MSADAVQAHPTTVVGSIGVIFSSMNFAGLMDKLGIEDQTIKGGEFKEVVELGRPKLTAEQVEVVADGRIYSARQALANGMVDRIGALNEAVGYLSDKMSAPRVQVVAYHRPSNQRRNLYMKSFPAAPSMSGAGISFGPASMPTALADLLRKPGFHYRPGLIALVENPREMAKLIDNPSLVNKATEENVRWTSLVIQFCRTPVGDFEMHGQKVKAGDSLCLL